VCALLFLADASSNLPGPRKLPRPQRLRDGFGSPRPGQVSSGALALSLASVRRRMPWDVPCPLLACDASTADETDRAHCGDAGCSGCPR
jgi:hypothetical protein